MYLLDLLEVLTLSDLVRLFRQTIPIPIRRFKESIGYNRGMLTCQPQPSTILRELLDSPNKRETDRPGINGHYLTSCQVLIGFSQAPSRKVIKLCLPFTGVLAA
jgi:hypothetical protein